MYVYIYISFLRFVPTWAMASSFMRFLDHIQRRTTVGRTPLDEWSARRRDFWQHTDIHAPGWIRTHSLSRWTAADLRLRPRGHWDRLGVTSIIIIWSAGDCKVNGAPDFNCYLTNNQQSYSRYKTQFCPFNSQNGKESTNTRIGMTFQLRFTGLLTRQLRHVRRDVTRARSDHKQTLGHV